MGRELYAFDSFESIFSLSRAQTKPTSLPCFWLKLPKNYKLLTVFLCTGGTKVSPLSRAPSLSHLITLRHCYPGKY